MRKMQPARVIILVRGVSAIRSLTDPDPYLSLSFSNFVRLQPFQLALTSNYSRPTQHSMQTNTKQSHEQREKKTEHFEGKENGE